MSPCGFLHTSDKLHEVGWCLLSVSGQLSEDYYPLQETYPCSFYPFVDTYPCSLYPFACALYPLNVLYPFDVLYPLYTLSELLPSLPASNVLYPLVAFTQAAFSAKSRLARSIASPIRLC